MNEIQIGMIGSGYAQILYGYKKSSRYQYKVVAGGYIV